MSRNCIGPSHAGATQRILSATVRRWLSLALLVAVLVFAGFALADSWSDVRESLRKLRAFDVVVAVASGVGSVWAYFRAWRALLHGVHADLPHADSRTMFFCSQLGKYVPGSVWPALIQTEIGARSRVPRGAVFTSYTFALLTSVGVGGVVAAGTLVHRSPAWTTLGAIGAAVGGIVLCIAFAHPRGTQRLWRRLLRRRASIQQLNPLGRSAVLATLGWTALGWCLVGVHVWSLARPLGATAGDLVFVAGAYALGWVAGVVAVPLPAGAGLRELVLVVTLGRLVGEPAAISVALVSRLLLVAIDIVLAFAAGLPAVLREVRSHRPSLDGAE